MCVCVGCVCWVCVSGDRVVGRMEGRVFLGRCNLELSLEASVYPVDSEEQHSRQGEQLMKRHGQMPHITETCVTGTKHTCEVC